MLALTYIDHFEIQAWFFKENRGSLQRSILGTHEIWKRGMTKKPTLKNVAQVAGVSEMTASRALRGVGDVSIPTREKVIEAARSLGYVPNRIAGALASRFVNLVAVVVPSLRSYVFPEVLSGITAGLKESGLQPVYGVANYDLETEETVIRDMLSWRPRGIIVAGLEHTEGSRQMLRNAGVPVVEIMDVDGDPIDYCVGVSHIKAGEKMARAIVERGYRRIGFIGSQIPLDFRAQKRFEGFRQALTKLGLELVDQALYSDKSSIARGRELTAEMLARKPDIDCLYFSSDVMSAGGLMHCIVNNISVPGDIALAGFNGLDLLEGLPQKLATADAMRFKIGLQAATFILNDEAATADTSRVFEIDPKIDFGETL